jgi:hypothetical protein
MGCYDIFCPFCGFIMNETIDYDNCYVPNEKIKINNKILEKFIKITRSKSIEWLTDDITLLFPDSTSKNGFVETDCNTHFANIKTGDKYYLDYSDAFAFHTECWKLSKIIFGRELKYEECKNFIDDNFRLYGLGGNPKIYFPSSKYWEQMIDFAKLSMNKDDWYILYSPLGSSSESKQNRERIIKILKKIFKIDKLKKKSKRFEKSKLRPSPTESATLFDVGYKKVGNDGNMYIIAIDKNNVKRWKKYAIKKMSFNQKDKKQSKKTSRIKKSSKNKLNIN